MKMTGPRPPRTEFVGVDFDEFTFGDAVEWLAARGAGDAFGYVVTPNVDHLVRLDRAPAALCPLYADAALRLCDSRIVSALARRVGIVLPVVPGSDLVAALFASVIADGDPVSVIGGRAAAIDKLRARHRGVRLRHVDAPMGLRDNSAARAAIIDTVSSHGARFILIAIGAPQQEMLAHEMLHHAGMTGTAMCIGASIDFMVGDQKRAPRALQRMGMEWAWRLASDPRRLWRRYVIEGPRIFLIFRAWTQARLPPRQAGR